MKQQWEIDREESASQIAAYIARRLPKGIDFSEVADYLKNNELPHRIGEDRTIPLDFWKVPSSGWQGASDDEFLSALIPLIIEELSA